MTHRRTSIADMARILNLATSTVSRALTQYPDVSEATRQRVRQLATELQYQPNQLAVALRKGRSNTLGVLVPHINGHFFPDVVGGITEAAGRAGYQVIICQSQEDARQEQQNLALLQHAQVAGVLVSLASTTQEFSHFERLRAAGVPLVFFDRALEGLTGRTVGSVVIDDYAGAYAAVAHLIAEGYRHIAHFTGPLHIGIYQHRHQGYCQALRDHGLPYRAELVQLAEQQAAGAAEMRRLLALATPPDAVFASHDLAAVGAMQELKAQAWRIPEDVGLVGFGNAEFTTLVEPALTTIDQGSRAIGGAAVQQLLQLLHPSCDSPAPGRVVLPAKLLIRASSQRASLRP